ncbi:MAG: MmcQ/YjbR family DNA-binding protein [Solirubrobacteraceae bacterium]
MDVLPRVSEICAELPESGRELSGAHAKFSVRGRTFAYFLDDHHGDGIVGVVCKAPAGMAAGVIGADPRYYAPAYLGPRGWVGLRLDTPEVDWDEVAGLIADSYLLVAPKRLAAKLEAGG